MAMKLFLIIGGLITLCVGESVYNGTNCICNVDHPQEKVCKADFAFVGTVMSSEDLIEFFMYGVTISDKDLIYEGLLYIGLGVTSVTVYTPYGSKLCGRPNLNYKETYLFTGHYLEGKLVITLCNWVQAWEDVTNEQRTFLATNEYLKHCYDCEVFGVKGALTKDQNENDLVYPGQVSGLWTPYNCYFNPVSSLTYGDVDCETAHTYCHLVKGERCDWKLTEEYQRCFLDRENTWANKSSPRLAAALTQFTTIKDCKKLTTKRMKKKCLKKVKNMMKNRKEELEPRAMLEELLDLRDLWLEDDDNDDEDLLIE